MARPAPGSGTLVIRRDSGFYGIACDHSIRVDGKFIANLNAGQEITLYPPAGEHSIEMSTGGAFCESKSAGAQAQVYAGRRTVYRTGTRNLSAIVEPSGEVDPVAPATQPPVQIAAPMPMPMPPPAIAKPPEPPVTRDRYGAERLAKAQSCSPEPSAVLTARGAGFETYTVACANGDAMAIRCEFGNCRVLR